MVYLMRQTVNLLRHGGDTVRVILISLFKWILKKCKRKKQPVIRATNSIVIIIHKD